jgi:hypothetical protein
MLLSFFEMWSEVNCYTVYNLITCMKKIKGSENALLTFGVLVPAGALGALVCLLVFVVTSIFSVLTFIFLLLCGFSSLTYGYLSRNLGHFHLRHKHL